MSPNQPKRPTRPIRVDLDEWEEFGKAAEAIGSDRSAVFRAYMQWFIHKPGAKQFKRPDRETWDKTVASDDEGDE